MIQELKEMLEPMSAIDRYAELSLIKKDIEGLIAEVKEEAIEEARLENEKTFVRNGIQFQYTNGRANYDFSVDDTYNEIKAELKEREKLMKQASKAWEMGTSIVDENGEVVPPAKVKYSADSLSVKLVTK